MPSAKISSSDPIVDNRIRMLFVILVFQLYVCDSSLFDLLSGLYPASLVHDATLLPSC